MSTATLPQPIPLQNLDLWRMSVETYHELVAAGTFAPDNDVELIHGYVVKKMSKNPPHAKANQWLLIFLSQIIGLNQGWYFVIQDPITLEDSEPEPDFAVVRGTPADYDTHPKPADVGLVIEVADSSLSYDEVVKKQMYALANIAEYWIVNTQDQQIQVYTEPYQIDNRAGYRHQRTYVVGDTVPVILDNQTYGQLRVSDIFA